jgi:prepilin-type N-terminal cleavage/methylation domain-containing protein
MRQFKNLTPHKSLRDYAEQAIKSKGVSLIEMLAAVAIFSIIVGAISGIFISAIRAQRRVLATQELLDQTSYVLEYMGRALRMAKKATDNSCIPDETNYRTVSPGLIEFIATKDTGDECTMFWLNVATNQIEKTVLGSDLYLTSSKLKVNSLKFNLSGESGSDTLQPRVTIFIEILGRDIGGYRPKIQIQTSISQRPLDVSL